MRSIISSGQAGIKGKTETRPRLSSNSQKVALVLWSLVTITSLISQTDASLRLLGSAASV